MIYTYEKLRTGAHTHAHTGQTADRKTGHMQRPRDLYLQLCGRQGAEGGSGQVQRGLKFHAVEFGVLGKGAGALESSVPTRH